MSAIIPRAKGVLIRLRQHEVAAAVGRDEGVCRNLVDIWLKQTAYLGISMYGNPVDIENLTTMLTEADAVKWSEKMLDLRTGLVEEKHKELSEGLNVLKKITYETIDEYERGRINDEEVERHLLRVENLRLDIQNQFKNINIRTSDGYGFSYLMGGKCTLIGDGVKSSFNAKSAELWIRQHRASGVALIVGLLKGNDAQHVMGIFVEQSDAALYDPNFGVWVNDLGGIMKQLSKLYSDTYQRNGYDGIGLFEVDDLTPI